MTELNLGLICTLAGLIIAVIARIEVRERRLANMQKDMYYMRRDVDQILRQYRLTPISEQERKRR